MDCKKYHLIEDRSKTYAMALMGPSKESEDNDTSEEEASSANELWQPAEHCHRNSSLSWTESQEKHLAKRKLLIACAVSLIFMFGEVIGGYAARSLAIMTDAAHLLTDFGSILLSLFSLWVSSRPPTKHMSFGWHRSEILGALFSVLSIWAVTAVLVFFAIQRIMNDDYEIHSHIMVITSGCAVGVNILMALILHQSPITHGHSHHGHHSHRESDNNMVHSHSHGYGNTSVRAAFIHVMGDLLQSFGVLLAAIVIHFRPELKMADPICTFLFSFFVLGTTVTILKDVFRILMEGVPTGIHFDNVREILLSLRGVKAMHNLHMWALTMSQTVLSVHVAIEKDADPQVVVMEATRLLESEFGFSSITIQAEQYSDDMVYCPQCQDLAD